MNKVLPLCLLCWCGCGQPPVRTRDVNVSSTVRTVQPGGVQHTASGIAPSYIGADGGTVEGTRSGSGWTFSVPEGPALFRFGLVEYVYSDADTLRPCLEGFEAASFFQDDAGIPFDLSWPVAAKRGDAIHVRGAPVPWLMPDAGAVELHQRLNVAIRRGGPATLAYLELEDAGAGTFAWHAIAVADAGVLIDATPAVAATFTALTPGSPQTFDWNADGVLQQLSGNGLREPGALELYVLQGETWLGRVYGPAQGVQQLTLTVPATTPSHVEVWTNSRRSAFGGEVSGGHFSFAAPWTGALSLVPPGGPARDVVIDGATVRWTAPTTAPGAYLVTFLERLTPSSSSVLATMFTDQTTVPIPGPAQGVSALEVDVQALTGGGVSAAGCPLDYKALGPPWSQYVSRAP